MLIPIKIRSVVRLQFLHKHWKELSESNSDFRYGDHTCKGVDVRLGICKAVFDMHSIEFFQKITEEWVMSKYSNDGSENLSMRDQLSNNYPVGGIGEYTENTNKFKNPVRKNYLEHMMYHSVKKMNFIE